MAEKKILYQFVTVLDPKTEEKDREGLFKKIESKLETIKAEIVSKEHFGLRDLVYKIMKNDRGDFWVWELESSMPLNIKEFNVYLNRETKIIRYLILKK